MIEDLGYVRCVKIGSRRYVIVDSIDMFDKIKEVCDILISHTSARFYAIDTTTHRIAVYDAMITVKLVQIMGMSDMQFVIDIESDIGKEIMRLSQLENL